MTTTSSNATRKPARKARARSAPRAKATFRSAISDAVSSSIDTTVAAIRRSASNSVLVASPKVLELAGKKAYAASAAMAKWGKKHPVKAAAAAAALLAAAQLLQVTMRKRAAAG
jgi:hypothetical protein